MPRRARCSLEILGTLRESGDAEPVQVAVRDLSAAGLGLECPRQVEPGQILQLHLHLPRSGVRSGLDLLASVIWCLPSGGGYRIGVRLESIEVQDLLALRARLARAMAAARASG